MHEVEKFDLGNLPFRKRGPREGSHRAAYPWKQLDAPGDGFRINDTSMHRALAVMASKEAKRRGIKITVLQDGQSVIVVRVA